MSQSSPTAAAVAAAPNAAPTARYPLPYAFARSQQLLLENQDGALTLWLHRLDASPATGGVGEVLRKYSVRHIATEGGGSMIVVEKIA